jgi:hypothetical protein
MEIHRKFTAWAITQGVEIKGIKPHRFPGKGVGIIAEKDLEVRNRRFSWILSISVSGFWKLFM